MYCCDCRHYTEYRDFCEKKNSTVDVTAPCNAFRERDKPILEFMVYGGYKKEKSPINLYYCSEIKSNATS